MVRAAPTAPDAMRDEPTEPFQLPESPARVEVAVLGGFEVSVDGRRLSRSDWQRASAERLVKLLLVTPGHSLSREAAAETLWPDEEPDKSRARLRKALHFAGRALAGSGLIGGDEQLRLDCARLDLDLDRLTTAFDQLGGARDGQRDGQRDGGGTDARAIATILQLGARELLPDDVFEDWLVAPREFLQNRWQRVALDAARRAREAGRRAEAHEIAARLIERDPTDEAAHRLAIELYAAEGRHHAARRQFELCRRALRDELDAEPSEETVATLNEAERTVPTAPAADESRAARLVARQRELELVEPILDRVAEGRLGACVIRGPTGIGKTRLLHEVVGYARAAGWRILEWQAVEALRELAYEPVRRGVLSAGIGADASSWPEPARSGLATLVPELGAPPALVFADRIALESALVAVLGRLASEHPLCIAWDDLQWLDDASVGLLQAVTAGLPHAPILLVATFRDDEPGSGGIDSFLGQVRRAGGVELPLGPLALRDVEGLVVGNLGGEAVDADVVRWAHEQSAGNPLFCLELVRTALLRGSLQLERGRWSRGSLDTPQELPASARRLVATRLAALPAPAIDLLVAAAELGPVVSFETLEAVLAELDGGVIAALDAALTSGLLMERDLGYAFAHPLFRLVVRGLQGPARRGAVHLRIAEALAHVPASAPAPEVAVAAGGHRDPMPVAEHARAAWELGATAASELAVAFGFAAARRAMRLLDRFAAGRVVDGALEIWRELEPAHAVEYEASAAYLIRAAVSLSDGSDGEAEAAFRDAIAAARTPDELAQAYFEFSWLPYRHGKFEAALALLDEGLMRLPADAAVARAHLRRMRGWCVGRLHRYDEALAELEDAVRVFEAAGDRRSAMYALDQLGMMLEPAGRPQDSLAPLERSLALALELGDTRGESVRAHVGATLTRLGQPARARPHLERALELCHQMGDWYLESIAAWLSAEMLDALGEVGPAVNMRHRELELLERIGGNPHNEALAHAHLAHLARLAGDRAGYEEEAGVARRLTAGSPDAAYVAQIERALAVEHWSELSTG